MSRTTEERMNGAKALIRIKVLGSSAFVRHKVSWSRADICKRCPLHDVHPEYSRIEAAENVIADAQVSGVANEKTRRLGQCTACRCHLPFLVHLRDEVATAGMNQEIADKMPAGCWKLRAWMEQGGIQSDDAPGKLLPVTHLRCKSCGG